MPTAWWLRPVSRHARVDEHTDVTWKRLYRSPPAAIRSMFGVLMAPPKHPSWANPTSSSTTMRTFGAPSGGRGYSTKVGCDVATREVMVTSRMLAAHGHDLA